MTTSVDSLSLDQLLEGAGFSGTGASSTPNPLEKKASQVPAHTSLTSAVAKDLEEHLTKQANEVTPTMTPSQQGTALAQNILAMVKRANDESMAMGGGNNVINETSTIAGMSTAGQQMQPNQGNPNQVLQMTLAQALQSGAVHPNSLDLNVIPQGTDEGNGQYPLQDMAGNYDLNAVPSAQGAPQMTQENIEKVAAVAHLIDQGVDFDNAVYLVKQAEASILADEAEMVKRAAVNQLCQEGYPVEYAVELVKQASKATEMARSAKDAVVGYGKDAGNFLSRGWNQLVNPRQTAAEFSAARNSRMGNTNPYTQEMTGPGRGVNAFNPTPEQQAAGMRATPAFEVPGAPVQADFVGPAQGGVRATGGAFRGLAPALTVGGLGVGGVGLAAYGANRALSKEATVHAALAQGYIVEQALSLLG